MDGETVMKYPIYFVSTLIVCAAVDFIWLTVMKDRLYAPVMGDMLAADPRLPAAAAFYLLYAAGVTIFVGAPALASGAWSKATASGALFGLFCYMTYDLTNQATLRDWSLQLTLADIAWGMFLTALSGTVAFFVTRALSPAEK
jgi:uncharacterized membrane protein